METDKEKGMKEVNRCETGDCRDIMRRWIDKGVKVQCCMTSPPYYGLRDYGVAGQIALEPVFDCMGWARGEACGACYVCQLREVLARVRELLADDGTFWLNLGDSYAAVRADRSARPWTQCASPAGNRIGSIW